MALIPISQHPLNTDPTATLVSGSRERMSVFRTSKGFVSVLDGMTSPDVFATESDARGALTQQEVA